MFVCKFYSPMWSCALVIRRWRLLSIHSVCRGFESLRRFDRLGLMSKPLISQPRFEPATLCLTCDSSTNTPKRAHHAYVPYCSNVEYSGCLLLGVHMLKMVGKYCKATGLRRSHGLTMRIYIHIYNQATVTATAGKCINETLIMKAPYISTFMTWFSAGGQA